MHKRIQVVVVALIKRDNTFLLTKRYDPKNRSVHNSWQLPGGGLEFNETVAQCAVREAKEETGLDVKIERLIPYIHEKIFFKSGWHGVAICFLCSGISKDQQVVLNHEATEYSWFSLEEISTLRLHHGTAAFFKKIKEVGEPGVEERT